MTAGTNVGCVRTNNEDNFIINDDLSQSDWFLPQDTSQVIALGEDGCILVVADGMGGLNAGEVASAIAIETVKQNFLDADLKKIAKTPKSIERFMRDIVGKADLAIKKHVKTNPETQGMGTTLIFIWVHGTMAHLIWCGDSRAYIYNKSNGLARFSKDHSYVQQLVDEGKLDEDLAFDHPESNIITRCLGDFQDKAKPDYKTHQLQVGDILLICSDGLCGLCRDEEILHIMQQTSMAIDICKQTLIQSALDAGGYDNVTLALFETVSIEESSKKEKIAKTQHSTIKKNFRDTKEVNEECYTEDTIIKQESSLSEDTTDNMDSTQNKDKPLLEGNKIAETIEKPEETSHTDEGTEITTKGVDETVATKRNIKKSSLILITLVLILIAAVIVCHMFYFEIPIINKFIKVLSDIRK